MGLEIGLLCFASAVFHQGRGVLEYFMLGGYCGTSLPPDSWNFLGFGFLST